MLQGPRQLIKGIGFLDQRLGIDQLVCQEVERIGPHLFFFRGELDRLQQTLSQVQASADGRDSALAAELEQLPEDLEAQLERAVAELEKADTGSTIFIDLRKKEDYETRPAGRRCSLRKWPCRDPGSFHPRTAPEPHRG